MNIKKGSWILMGIVFWGIPTGIIVSLSLAFMDPNQFGEIHAFQQAIFLKSLFIFVPIFSFLGIFFGLYFHNLFKKYSTNFFKK